MLVKEINGNVFPLDGTIREATAAEISEFETQRAKNEAMAEIISCKHQLAQSDYLALKYAEGYISEEDYAPIKAQRQAWRDKINELEAGV